MKYYVVRDESTVIWCWKDEALEWVANGWELFGVANSESEANQLCEKACY